MTVSGGGKAGSYPVAPQVEASVSVGTTSTEPESTLHT